MTPFGARLRVLRADRGVTLKHLAEALQVSAAYLSALEHGKRGAPSAGLVHQVNEFFGLIWDDADDLSRLARLSNPRVTVNTAGLTPEQTALANRLAQVIHRLSPAGQCRGAARGAGHCGAAIEAPPASGSAVAGTPWRRPPRTLSEALSGAMSVIPGEGRR